MPTYDYRCRKCSHVFEVFHSMTDETPRRCPQCRARAERMLGTGAGLLFKGSGFYITDYRSPSYREKAKSDGAGGAGGEGAGGGSAGVGPAASGKGAARPKRPGAGRPKSSG
uniref:Zinc ribbon domain-containing protein n=1 Tax=Eiseniibacteriota bacterium TaxID=2212470 RepID=A0A832I9H5_UNCEI